MASSAHQRLIEFIKRLVEHTKEGRLEWTSTDESDKAFMYAGPNSSVVLTPKAFSGRSGIELQLLNERGSVVTSLRSSWYERPAGFVSVASGETVTVPESWNSMLIELYEEARRIALNVDEVMSDLLSAIEDSEEGEQAGGGQPEQAE
jgi:hypothetical protein